MSVQKKGIWEMFDYKCENAERHDEGIKKYFWCTKMNDYCSFQRICPTKKDVEHTEKAQYCMVNPNRIKKNK